MTLSRQFIEDRIEPILKAHFQRDEFLGRINEILYFLPFNERELKELTVKELKKWKAISMETHRIALEWDDDAVNLLKDGYNFRYGARSIRHEVEKRIINQIAAVHEKGDIRDGSVVRIVGDAEGGRIRIQCDNANVAPERLWDDEEQDGLAEGQTEKKESWFW